PEAGPALVVANHSGTLPVDAVMLQAGLHDEHPTHRNLRLLGADLVYEIPLLAPLARKGGHTRACPANANVLLRSGELVGVFPEGFKGIGKPFSDRYQLQQFGRGGFAATAIRARVPIIPCAIVGAEEIYPLLGNARPIAELLGLPYFPITPLFPWLGPVAVGRAMRVARRPDRKSCTGQWLARASARSSASGLITVGCPTRRSIGRSFAESL